jgi:hypothetical protein
VVQLEGGWGAKGSQHRYTRQKRVSRVPLELVAWKGDLWGVWGRVTAALRGVKLMWYS